MRDLFFLFEHQVEIRDFAPRFIHYDPWLSFEKKINKLKSSSENKKKRRSGNTQCSESL